VNVRPGSVQWPRSYPLTGGWKYFLLLGGAAALAGGIACFVFGAGADKPPSAHAVMYVVGAIMAGLGAVCIAYGVRFRIVLNEHFVEVHGLLKVSAMKRDEVAARRVLHVEGTTQIELIPKDPKRKPLQLPQIIRTDDAFFAWLQPIPDQDAEDLQRATEAISANPAFGLTPQSRVEHAARFAQMARWLGSAIAVATIWAFVYPRPYELVIVVLLGLPVVALAFVVASKGAVGLDGAVREGRALVGPMLFGPSIVLLFRAWWDFDTLEWLEGLGIAATLAAPITYAITRIDPGRKPASLLLIGSFFVIPYLYGGLIESNVLLDQSRPQRFAAPVQSKEHTTGKGASWDLTLGAWGPVTDANEVSVTKALYENVAVGDSVCVYLFEGRWTLSWYVVRACPNDSHS
jgi:hypothetical protein